MLRGDEFVHLALTWTRDGRIRLFVNGQPAVGTCPAAKGSRLDEGVGVSWISERARDFRFERRAWSAAEVSADYRKACPLDVVMDDSLVMAGEPDEAEWILAPGGTYTFPKPAPGLTNVSASASCPARAPCSCARRRATTACFSGRARRPTSRCSTSSTTRTRRR